MKDLKDHLDNSCNLISNKQNIPYEITNELNEMNRQIKELQNMIKDLQSQLQSEKVQTEQLKHLKSGYHFQRTNKNQYQIISNVIFLFDSNKSFKSKISKILKWCNEIIDIDHKECMCVKSI
ncbi:hypothetical protein RFI_39327 [Reticulomyxa filosa]|uniref:Uncharacterized protein n=1 Tax=Reticulomyxa filosa TaxID=46433 RepID=X6LAL9_RETFI|nr:hypothetical protein RFI_39327 [Reticulomyxa filosa]|eukprot:ETN98186.1 hypothetical protein RFI_39327 [Reticulomyxa filosa]